MAKSEQLYVIGCALAREQHAITSSAVQCQLPIMDLADEQVRQHSTEENICLLDRAATKPHHQTVVRTCNRAPAGAEDHGWPTHSSEHPLPPSESGCKLRQGRGWPRRAERDTNPHTQAYRPTEARLPPFGGSVFSSRSSRPWLADSLKQAPKQKAQGSRPQRS